MPTRMPKFHHGLHRFSKTVAAATFVLIFIGGLVTSTGSGLAVPDWPNTYGHFMFSFPLSSMVGGILYEHGHRMVASVVGFLTVVLTTWIWLTEARKWVRWFAFGALIAVIAQGLLGGITVLYQLPTVISVLHGCVAQAFFLMTVAMTMFTSREWLDLQQKPRTVADSRLLTLTIMTTSAIYLQLILGAIMRHTGSGLAIPDFPLAFGKIIPPIHTQAVAIHFLHRIGAVVVSAFVLLTVYKVTAHHRENKKLYRPAIALLITLILQITLAGLTIWTRKAVLPTTAHVATGAFILANSLFLMLRTYLFVSPDKQSSHLDLTVEHAPAS